MNNVVVSTIRFLRTFLICPSQWSVLKSPELECKREAFCQRSEMYSSICQEVTFLMKCSDLTEAHFLQTTDQLLNDGCIHWDPQVVNNALSVIQRKKNSTAINMHIPGLQRLTVAVFSLEVNVLQIYVDNEPICSYQPTTNQLNSQVEESITS